MRLRFLREGSDPGCRHFIEDRAIPLDGGSVRRGPGAEAGHDRTRHWVKGDRVGLKRRQAKIWDIAETTLTPPVSLGIEDACQSLCGAASEGEVERRREQERTAVCQHRGMPASAEHVPTAVDGIRRHDGVLSNALREPVPRGETCRVGGELLAILGTRIGPALFEHGLLREQQSAISTPELCEQGPGLAGDHHAVTCGRRGGIGGPQECLPESQVRVCELGIRDDRRPKRASGRGQVPCPHGALA